MEGVFNLKTIICLISLFGEHINLETDSVPAVDFLRSLKHLFNIESFECKIIDKSRLFGNSYRLIFLDREEPKLIFDPNSHTLVLHERWTRIEGNYLLRSLILQLIEAKFQERDRFIIHASSIAFNGKGIAMIGQRGSGKSLLALTLCTKHGCRLVSNDRAVIGLKDGLPYIFDGNKIFNLRLSSVEIADPKLANKLFKNYSRVTAWNTKRKLHCSDLAIKISTGIIELKALIVVDIRLGWQGKPCFYQVPDNSSPDPWLDKIRIYQELSQLIRGTEFCQMTTGYRLNPLIMMPLLDNDITFANRTNFIEKLVEERKLYILHSNLDDAQKLSINVLM